MGMIPASQPGSGPGCQFLYLPVSSGKDRPCLFVCYGSCIKHLAGSLRWNSYQNLSDEGGTLGDMCFPNGCSGSYILSLSLTFILVTLEYMSGDIAGLSKCFGTFHFM